MTKELILPLQTDFFDLIKPPGFNKHSLGQDGLPRYEFSAENWEDVFNQAPEPIVLQLIDRYKYHKTEFTVDHSDPEDTTRDIAFILVYGPDGRNLRRWYELFAFGEPFEFHAVTMAENERYKMANYSHPIMRVDIPEVKITIQRTWGTDSMFRRIHKEELSEQVRMSTVGRSADKLIAESSYQLADEVPLSSSRDWMEHWRAYHFEEGLIWYEKGEDGLLHLSHSSLRLQNEIQDDSLSDPNRSAFLISKGMLPKNDIPITLRDIRVLRF